jgi:hypothetical protein
MKTHFNIVLVLALVLVLGGCAGGQRPEVGSQKPDGGSQISDLRALASDLRLPASVIGPPPLTNEIVFHFIYPRALTNGFIESSTDLVHWETRTDYTVDNADTWTLHPDPTKQMEFYRAGGEAIGD